MRFGSAGGGRVPAWDQRRIYVVDESAGRTVAAFELSGRRVTAAALDAGGIRIAALLDDGSALYWAALDAAPLARAGRAVVTREGTATEWDLSGEPAGRAPMRPIRS